jgi:hypothetical protein
VSGPPPNAGRLDSAEAVKKRFLVLHDYGQGGNWAFIWANSPEEIRRRFPEFEIVDRIPEWLSGTILERTEERMTFDVGDSDSEWLNAVIAERKAR